MWKSLTRYCPSEADFTAEALQQWPEKELKHRRFVKIRQDPYKLRSLKSPYTLKNTPNFFKISFTAQFGLEHKIELLKICHKKPPVARQRSLHECRSPSVKTFWRSAVVRQLLAEHHLLLQPIFLTQRPQCFTQQRHRLESSYFLLKLFNISIPVAKELLKHTSARTVHAKVIVKPARVV